MNVLGISGTPRKDGNSEILLRYALHPFEKQRWQVKHFRLSEMMIQPCRACEEECKGLGNCIIDDDRPLEGKAGGAIVVGRGTCGGQTITINAIYTWMLSCGVICVPGELNGVTAVASEPGDILKQENRLRQAEILGSNVLNVAKKLRSGTNCG